MRPNVVTSALGVSNKQLKSMVDKTISILPSNANLNPQSISALQEQKC
jgi:hypothetical protein